MFTTLLTCSDEDCDEIGAFVGSLDAAEAVVCDGCGCLMQIVAIEGGHEPADVIDLAAHRASRAGVSRATARRPRPPAHSEVA